MLVGGLYLTVPAAVALSQTSLLSFMTHSSIIGFPGIASAITALQGSSIAAALLPSSVLTRLTSFTTTTFGAVALSLPLLAQIALVAPPLIAAGYVATKAYRGT